MKYAFYITNHGYGHASRNVPIMMNLLDTDKNGVIYVKSDRERCDFLQRNLEGYHDRIRYYDDCSENGLILHDGTMQPDVEKMERVIKKDFESWDSYVEREVRFLKENSPDIVIADVICWALKAAKICGIKSLLIGNFSWAQMYKSFFGSEIWKPYEEYYKLADKALWYEIHAKELHEYCEDYECISMVSRPVNKETVARIKSQHKQPIVFVSLGASADVKEEIEVNGLPYDFITTRGIKLRGDNVTVLPLDMINTPDYIAASEYVIAKGGWSTIAEILLQKKKCALLFRGNNSEDNQTARALIPKEHCVGLDGSELKDIGALLEKIKALNPKPYDDYRDDKEKICDIIRKMMIEG